MQQLIMSKRHQLFYAMAIFTISLLFGEALAKVDTADNAINNLYDSLLQREYAGPVVFPNHQVERKAQRSPSLRLRFGRSDPDMLPSAQKRWFGDVNQKPIRSPSLRLRFGRRSDPSVPLHSSFDELMNMGAAGGGVADNTGVAAAVGQNVVNDYDDDFDVSAFERVLRKPQRLRWGRSVPFEAIDNQAAGNYLDDETELQRTDDYFTALLNTEKLRNMLLAIRKYDEERNDESDEFQREVRKPGPLRLRWGRSTGGRAEGVPANSEQKKTPAQQTQEATENAKNKN